MRFDFHTCVFLSRNFEFNCGDGCRSLSEVAEPRWILLANIFSAHGVPIGAESVRRQVFAPDEILFRFLHQLVVNAERRKPGYLRAARYDPAFFSLRRMLNADHGAGRMARVQVNAIEGARGRIALEALPAPSA
jgi:hypothetical protein